MNRFKQADFFLYLWYIALFISMICCFRAISSIAIALILLTGIIKNKIENGFFLNERLKLPFLLACCLIFILQLVSLFYNSGFNKSLADLQEKTALFFIPLALCCCNFVNKETRYKLMKPYVSIMAAAMLYCLLTALYKFIFQHAQPDVFFYHQLVLPFKQHAVQVSIYFFVALVYLRETIRNGVYLFNRRIHFAFIFYFILCLFLLSSRLVISFSVCCLLYYVVLFLKLNIRNRFPIFVSLSAGLILLLVVFSTTNHVSKRFAEILHGNPLLVEQKEFSPAIYFNGLQFRLLQWRFVKEILDEHNAWLTGVSGDAQKLLDQKYTSTHMYTGDGGNGSRGYLSYNTHNQFLQSLLQMGIPGLFVFILICYAMILLVLKRKNRELDFVVILLLAYCFNEAVFETQYGLMLFTFFPLFLYFGTENISVGDPRIQQ